MRSIWKGPFGTYRIFNSLTDKKNFFNTKKKNLRTAVEYGHIRNLLILDECVGQTYYVHTGRYFLKLKIKEKMRGYKFGDFVYTSKYPVFAKKKKKKQKKGKKKRK